MKLHLSSIAIAVLSFSAHVAWSQSYSFQNGIQNYSGTHEVTVIDNNADASRGDLFLLRNTSTQANVFLKFEVGGLSSGNYAYFLRLAPSSVISSGTIEIRMLKKSDWTDSSSVLDPPSAGSSHPTWSHQKFNAIPWEASGAAGQSDVDSLSDAKWIENTTPIVFAGTISLKDYQQSAQFKLSALSGAEIQFFDKESTDAQTAEKNPALILVPVGAGRLPSLQGSWNLR